MLRLLSILTLILAIILFPPAVLAVISNNAVPGDATYPIKRSLENVILAAASVSPSSKAWFSQTRSNRRYKEFTTLISQGKETTNTLSELVEQTDLAVTQITQVTNQAEKEKLIEQLSQSIEKYDDALKQYSEDPVEVSEAEAIAQVPTVIEEDTPSQALPQTISEPEPASIPTQTPGLAAKRAAQTPQPQTPAPTSTPKPTSVSTPIVIATQVPIVTPKPTREPIPSAKPAKDEQAERQRKKEIEEARKKFEENKKELEEQKKKLEEEKKQKKEEQRSPRKSNTETPQAKEESNLAPNREAGGTKDQ